MIVRNTHHWPNVNIRTIILEGLKPSIVKASPTFLGSTTNLEYETSNDFYTLPYIGCLTIPFEIHFLASYLRYLVASDDTNSLCSLSLSGK